MGYNWKFELYKLKREIKKRNEIYVIERVKKDEYGEPTGEWEEIGSFKGLFHENQGGFAYLIVDTGAKIIDKKDTWILCDYEEVKAIGPKLGDRIKINEKYYEVNYLSNIQEKNIIGDINLKVKNNDEA